MMISIEAPQHLFSSVERGYFPKHGRGFQTIAMTSRAIHPEDLRVLEDAAFYALSRERRAKKSYPVKETFFQLPSEKFAFGRTLYLGVDSLGREGNYLAHHLILSREEFLALEANPFVVFDGAEWADYATNLKPRELPPLSLKLNPIISPSNSIADLNAKLLANLVVSAIGQVAAPMLLAGDENLSREYLKGLFDVLAIEDRPTVTFSTHHYDADHLRNYFRIVTTETRIEAPSQNYRFQELNQSSYSVPDPAGQYAKWIVEALQTGNIEEIFAFNNSLKKIRHQQNATWLPETKSGCLALWERVGSEIANSLVGKGESINLFLVSLASPRELANALLQCASPSNLCETEAPTELIRHQLELIKSAASSKVWSEWRKKWSSDPILIAAFEEANPWWKIWGRS